VKGLRLPRRCNRRHVTKALGRVALAFACGLVLLVGCGGGDGSGSDRVEPVPIRGGERLAWNQAADSIAQLKSLTFRLYIDGTESTLAATQCDEVPGPLGFECSGMLPPISSGQHLLELTSVLGGVESQRSPSLLVIVTWFRYHNWRLSRTERSTVAADELRDRPPGGLLRGAITREWSRRC
jgi:hypothetical protein